MLSVNGTLPFGIFASPYDPSTGILTLFGYGSHADYQTAIEQIRFSTTAPVGTQKTIAVWVFDGYFWSNEADAFITVTSAAVPPVLDLDANNSNGGGADYTATFTSGGLGIPVADTDVSITDADSTTIQSATITIAINRQPGDVLSVAGALPARHHGFELQSLHRRHHAQRLRPRSRTIRRPCARWSSTPRALPLLTASFRSPSTTVPPTAMSARPTCTSLSQPPNVPPALDLDANNSTTPGANYLTGFTDGGPAVAIVDTDVLIIDSDSHQPRLGDGHADQPDTDDVLTFNGAPPPASSLPSTIRHKCPHAHGRRVAGRLSDGAAADHVQQHRHHAVDRYAHHRHCRQRRRQQQQHGTGLHPGRGGEQQRSGAGSRSQ